MTSGTAPAAPGVDTARVFAFLEETERAVPVADWTMDGLRVWPLLRNYHAFGLITQHEYNADSQIVRYAGGWQRAKQILRSMGAGVAARWKDRRANHSPSMPADVVCLIASSTRFFRVGGRWYSPYCDSFRAPLAARGMTVGVHELAADGAYRIPRYAPSALMQNAVFTRAMLAKLRSRKPPRSEQLEGWTQMVEVSDRILGPGHTYPLSLLRFRAAQVHALRALFHEALSRARPAVGLFTGYYSAEAMAFILACRELGIRTVEVQHGVQGPWHFAYARWHQVPVGGYELLPEIFWTWDEHARSVIAEWADGTGGAHRAICGGNPCLSLPPSVSEPTAAPGATRVLFTAQAFFGLPPAILDAMAASPAGWHWWVRVHPQYWETREPIRQALQARGLRNWSIDDASDAPMATVLAASDVHVTEFSSSVLEAEALGVPSVVVHPKARDLFDAQLASGMARFGESGSAIADAIAAQIEGHRGRRGAGIDPARAFARGCEWLADTVREVRGSVVAHS